MKTTKWAITLLSMAASQSSLIANPFEGIRAGLQGGYGLIDSTLSLTQQQPPNATDSSSIAGRGAIGGLTIDWNSLIGNSDILMGAEASLNFITCKGKKSTQSVSLTTPPTANDLATTILVKRSYDFAVRFGFLFKSAALAYIKAGPSFAHWKASSVSNSLPASGAVSLNILGVLVGIGAEFPLSERFSFGMEYTYRHYTNYAHILNNNNPPITPLLNVQVKPNVSAIMLRLNYRISAADFVPTPAGKERKRKKNRKPRDECP